MGIVKTAGAAVFTGAVFVGGMVAGSGLEKDPSATVAVNSSANEIAENCADTAAIDAQKAANDVLSKAEGFGATELEVISGVNADINKRTADCFDKFVVRVVNEAFENADIPQVKPDVNLEVVTTTEKAG